MLPVLAVLLAAVLFGTTGTAQALGPAETTPLSVGVVRLTLGGTILGLLAAVHARRPAVRARRPRVTARAVALMAVTALCLAAYQPLFFLGTSRNGVAVGTVIALGSAPVITGILEWLLSARRPAALWWPATALATVGVVLLGAGGASTQAGSDPVGVACSVLAGGSFAVITVAQRRLLDAGWHPFTVVGAMGAGAALLALGALPFADLSWLGTGRGLAVGLWLGLATIVAAYGLFTWGLAGLSAATAATLTLGEPLTASLLGVFVLGESLSPAAVIGLIVLASGLLILALGSRRSSPAPVSAV